MVDERRIGMPAEWSQHRACITAYPHLEEAWGPDFEGARVEIAAFCRALADEAGERVKLLVATEECEADARARIAALGSGDEVELVRLPYGDSWLRDTGPIIVRRDDGALEAALFRFDGWGGKFRMEGDEEVGALVARRLGLPSTSHDYVLEGGAIDVDGEGTCLSTESCLLDRIRNADASREVMEVRLEEALGIRKVIWLKRGLANDHTDGHVDTLARFVGDARVVCMSPGDDEPNAEVLEEIAGDLEAATDALGRRLTVLRVPSPGPVLDRSGTPMPASYMNFFIGNEAVIVPTYGSPRDDAAVAALADAFPDRKVLGRPSRHILAGGGAFHCITQQIPRASE